MNERIKLLAEKAVTRFDKDMNGYMEPEELGQWVRWDDLQNLAELIVQECIDTVKKRFMGDLNREDMEIQRCIEDLKKHFGVE